MRSTAASASASATASRTLISTMNCSEASSINSCNKDRASKAMDFPPSDLQSALSKSRFFSTPPPSRPCSEESSSSVTSGNVTLLEWQGWGASSPVPAMVSEVIRDLKLLEKEFRGKMGFGGPGGKLQGDFKIQEANKHRARYQALDDSEKKIQFFSARQIACRLLGSRDYLCQKCWLPQEDCMCSKIVPSTLCQGMRFWIYMHPKDFLRQNNTGKLLWQVFGVQAATLCLYGIAEDEEILWNALTNAGKSSVWCLYPSRNACAKSVEETFVHESLVDLHCSAAMGNSTYRWVVHVIYKGVRQGGNIAVDSTAQTNGDGTLNFILIDGTWSNSVAMFRRLKERAELVWGEDFPCISLSTGASPMHKLRPQPSWDRTCTVAAAIGLLLELHSLVGYSLIGLDKQAEAVEYSLVVLLDALTSRRLRMGRSITRKERHKRDIC